jgi:hypothetical protein
MSQKKHFIRERKNVQFLASYNSAKLNATRYVLGFISNLIFYPLSSTHSIPTPQISLKTQASCWAQWYVPVIPGFRRLRAEDHLSPIGETSLGNTVRFCFKK